MPASAWEVGLKIKARRAVLTSFDGKRRKPMTQAQLAAAVGVKRQTIVRIESGGPYPDQPPETSVKIMQKIATALGLELDRDLLKDGIQHLPPR
jgi:DNA-binding XRE family transcriptional regulator